MFLKLRFAFTVEFVLMIIHPLYMSRTQKAAYFSTLRTLIERRKAIMTHNLETSETLNLISRNISQRIKSFA